jgi:hypothetical protein
VPNLVTTSGPTARLKNHQMMSPAATNIPPITRWRVGATYSISRRKVVVAIV